MAEAVADSLLEEKKKRVKVDSYRARSIRSKANETLTLDIMSNIGSIDYFSQSQHTHTHYSMLVHKNKKGYYFQVGGS